MMCSKGNKATSFTNAMCFTHRWRTVTWLSKAKQTNPRYWDMPYSRDIPPCRFALKRNTKDTLAKFLEMGV